MASGVKFHKFVDDLSKAVHDLSSDTLKVALTNTAPDAASDAVFGDITEISAGNGYTAGGFDITAVYDATAGTVTITGTDVEVEADGGALPEFRYVVLYNDTPTTPADPLICYWDRGSGLTLGDGESVILDLSDDDKAVTVS